MVDVEADDGTRVICSPEVQSVRTVRSVQQQLGTGGADRFGDEKDTHMPVIEVRFKLEKETKGALRYQEVDEKGKQSSKPGPRSARSTCAKVLSSVALHFRRRCA